jgi:DNA-binding NarL/FixJ family response regulator
VPRLTEEWFAATERRTDLRLAAGAHAELVPTLRDLTAPHPFRESLWCRLIVALHRSGRQADALAAGCTNQEIADRLSILPTTVKTHLRNAMRKLGARNRVEAVSAARHAGLLR